MNKRSRLKHTRRNHAEVQDDEDETDTLLSERCLALIIIQIYSYSVHIFIHLFCYTAILDDGVEAIYKTKSALSPDLPPCTVASPLPKLVVPFPEIRKAAESFG